MSGRLVVVGTPIGNLDDLSGRAVKALASADVILCEDTRRTRKLLSAAGVNAPRLLRLDQHTEYDLAERVAAMVGSGDVVVLVSDAGMPTISDPGTSVVGAVASAGGRVEVVPGPTAVSTALAVSGLPASTYRFAGFLARKGRDRRAQLDALATSQDTTVIYESPHRVLRTVEDLEQVCGPARRVVLARELTKLHEEVWRATLGEARERLGAKADSLKGEWVVVVAGSTARREPAGGSDIEGALRAKLAMGMDRKRAVAEVTSEMGVPRRAVYAASLAITD